MLEARGIRLPDARILELFAELEASSERGSYIPYGAVLTNVVHQLGRRLGFQPTQPELDALWSSLPNWQPFPDTVAALRELHKRFRLAVISNVDNDLFASSAGRLEVDFDWVVTSQETKAYKPSPEIFRYALNKIGVPKERVLHVAQSLYHDIVPARLLGLKCVWVNRRREVEDSGATPPTGATADLEVPELAALVDMTTI